MAIQKKMKIKNVLITGGLGFIGNNIAKHLVTQNKKVVIFDNSFRGKFTNILNIKNKIKIIKGDLTVKKDIHIALKNIDTIIHCAAINGTKNFYKNPSLVLDVGVKGLINLVDCCKHKKINNFFIASSSEVYHLPKKIPTDEKVKLVIPDVFNSRYSYAGSKIFSELYAIHNCSKIFKRTIIFRPHNVYGSNMGYDHVIPELIMKIRTKGNNLQVQGTGNETRSFINIKDFINAFDILLKKGKNLNIYNIGTNERITIKKLTNMMLKIFKSKKMIKYRKLAKGGTKHRCPDIKKISKLGFKQKIKLREGIYSLIHDEK
tara:strand:+ start:528 stop:1481 length:954 start_codon:yes stop_codon:yes gene_type:complete